MSMNLEQKKLPELKEILLKFNLSTIGKKNELIQRIQEHFKNGKKPLVESSNDEGSDDVEEDEAEPGEVPEANCQRKATRKIATLTFDAETEKLQARAKRFGLGMPGTGASNLRVSHFTTKQPMAEIEAQQLEEKKRQRALRFGIQAMTEEQRQEARFKRFNSQIPPLVVDASEVEKRRRRAERFNKVNAQ